MSVEFRSVDRHGHDPRILAIPDPRLSVDYSRATAPVVDMVQRRLRPEAPANRVWAGAPDLVAHPWLPARERFVHRVRRIVRDASDVLATDVRACYAEIQIHVVASRLRAIGVERQEVRSITAVLERFERAGVRGLPIGPLPSAVLANAVLQRVDDAIVAPGLSHARWVDDLVIAAGDTAVLGAARTRLEEALGDAGLRCAPEKTRRLAGGLHGARNVLRGGGSQGAEASSSMLDR